MSRTTQAGPVRSAIPDKPNTSNPATRLNIGADVSRVAGRHSRPTVDRRIFVDGPADHRSRTISPVGIEQQINTFPEAGGSSGSG
jgi:hypothetical protein